MCSGSWLYGPREKEILRSRGGPQICCGHRSTRTYHQTRCHREGNQGRLPEQRREVRSLRSRPLLDSLKQWLEETLGKLSRKSDTAVAVRYALGQWNMLELYCDDGLLEIDDNAAERALRAVSFRPKELEKYLCDILSRIADHPINRIEELLPWNLVTIRSEQASYAA
jgi:transposase